MPINMEDGAPPADACRKSEACGRPEEASGRPEEACDEYAVYRAAEAGDVAVLEALCARTGGREQAWSWARACWHATQAGRLDALRWCEARSDIEYDDVARWALADVAACAGHADVLVYCLERAIAAGHALPMTALARSAARFGHLSALDGCARAALDACVRIDWRSVMQVARGADVVATVAARVRDVHAP